MGPHRRPAHPDPASRPRTSPRRAARLGHQPGRRTGRRDRHLLLTDEDHYNALAATTFAGGSGTPVYRLAPSDGAASPYTPGDILFAPALTHPALTARYAAGGRITTQSSDGGIPPATDLLFLINPEGTLIPATASRHPDPQPGDTLILLGQGGNGTPH